MNSGHVLRFGISGIAALGITCFLLMAGPMMEKKVSAPPELKTDPVMILAQVPPRKILTRETPPPPKEPPTLKPPERTVSKSASPAIAQPVIQAFPTSELPPISIPPIPEFQVQDAPQHLANMTQEPKPPAAAVNDVFDMGQVDQMPRVIRYLPPVYPPRARGRQIQGKVVVRCIISAKGEVTEAKIRSAKPQGYFEKTALESVKKWRFAPAKSNGQAVAVYVDIPLTFSLD